MTSTKASILNNRRDLRDVYYGYEGMKVNLKTDNFTAKGEVVDFNQNGMGIVIPNISEGLHAGEPIYLSLQINEKDNVDRTGVITNVTQGRYGGKICLRAGVSFVAAKSKVIETHKNDDLRKSKRIAIPDFFRPIAFCENPLKMGEILHFQVVDVSASGILLTTSARNRSLIENIHYRLMLFLPGNGSFCVEVKSAHVRIDPKNEGRLLVGANFVGPSKSFLEAWVETLLIAGCDVSLKSLKENGFPIGRATFGFTIGYSRSAEDLEEIMRLRLLGQQHEGRFSDVTDPWNMQDPFDKFSRHILARAGKKIVAATRLVYNEGDKSKSEHAMMGAEIPKWLWEEGFVESSRSVTHPEYRGSDLFISLTRHMGRVVLHSGYKYMLSSCEDKLLNFYTRSGCKQVGSFYCADMPKTKWHLIVIDMEEITRGVGVGPLTWNIVQAPVFSYLVNSGAIQLSSLDKVRMKIYQRFSGIAAKLYDKQKSKRKKG